jgi:hypothetical protein
MSVEGDGSAHTVIPRLSVDLVSDLCQRRYHSGAFDAYNSGSLADALPDRPLRKVNQDGAMLLQCSCGNVEASNGCEARNTGHAHSNTFHNKYFGAKFLKANDSSF